MKLPKGITSHPGVERVELGEDQGSDSKYWVHFKDGWGYYEDGRRDDCCWICGGCAVESVADFKDRCDLEYRTS